MNAITATGTDPFATLNGSNTPRPESSQDMSETFLKLLVTQMQNQDPLNPMDNAQVTSQMAQINTVSGIEKLNTTMQGIAAQFSQSQALQGASLVGHDVMQYPPVLAVLLLITVVGLQTIVDPGSTLAQLLPLWATRELLSYGIEGHGDLSAAWAHAATYGIAMLVVGFAITWSRLRSRAHMVTEPAAP